MTLSRITAGVWKWGQWGHQLSTDALHMLVNQCIDLGVTTFDHADIYGDYTSESDFGEVLKKEPSLRHRMQIVTKCGIKLISTNRPNHIIKSYDTGAAHIRYSVENSLRQLKTDYVDVLLIHRPDPLLDPDEVVDIFTTLKQEGKVLAFGVSNFTPAQLALLQERIPLITNQIKISILHTDSLFDGSLDACMQHRITPMAWSPLGSGALFRDESPQINHIKNVAKDIADKYNVTFDQVLVAWLLRHPSGIIPVLGTAQFSRIEAAWHAQSIHLTREEWFSILQAARGVAVP